MKKFKKIISTLSLMAVLATITTNPTVANASTNCTYHRIVWNHFLTDVYESTHQFLFAIDQATNKPIYKNCTRMAYHTEYRGLCTKCNQYVDSKLEKTYSHSHCGA